MDDGTDDNDDNDNNDDDNDDEDNDNDDNDDNDSSSSRSSRSDGVGDGRPIVVLDSDAFDTDDEDTIDDLLLDADDEEDEDDAGDFGPIVTPLVRALVDQEPLDVIEPILHRAPESMRQKVRGTYPMSYAVERGSPLEVVRALHLCWPGSVQAEDAWGDGLPLHKVGANTPVGAVEFLIGAHPGALRHEARRGLPLHASIQGGAPTPAVRLLAERDPESLLEWGGGLHLPIHLALIQEDQRRSTNFELVEYLAQRCPESLAVPTKDVGKELPIHLAAKARAEPMPLHVMDTLAGLCPESLLATTAHGLLPVHLALQSSWGVARERVGVIQRLAAETIPEGTRHGLLHFTLRELERIARDGAPVPGHLLDNVSALAEAIPSTLYATDAEGSLPIHVAVLASSNLSTMDLLRILVPLDRQSLLRPNAHGELPLHIALDPDRCKNPHVADFLVESSPPSALVAGREGNFPIHAALANARLESVKRIVEHCPGGCQLLGAKGRTPMHIAATLPWWHGCHRLLDAAGALVRTWPESLLIADVDGNLPIHVAIDCSEDWVDEFIRFLIERSPDSLRVAGAGGRLPLHAAVSKRNPSPKLVKLLVERWDGALDVRDLSGSPPLLLAFANRTAPPALIYTLMRTNPGSAFGRGSWPSKAPKRSNPSAQHS